MSQEKNPNEGITKKKRELLHQAHTSRNDPKDPKYGRPAEDVRADLLNELQATYPNAKPNRYFLRRLHNMLTDFARKRRTPKTKT